MKLSLRLTLLVFTFILISCTDSPQQPDPNFKPQSRTATFTATDSPLVLVDEAHHNFLTIHGRYMPFEMVLSSDGFTVKSNTKRFTASHLDEADILVIANALDYQRKDWQPPFGSALDDDEVTSVKQWVIDGGALLLIADHAPFPKAIENLASAFGFQFSNGHVEPSLFRKTDNTLSDHAITRGKNATANRANTSMFLQELKSIAPQTNAAKMNKITQVKTFGGSAFKAPKDADVLMKLGSGVISLETKIPFQVDSSARKIPVENWSQGAVMTLGQGRIAVFSEGTMFSSQFYMTTDQKRGFGSIDAEQNEQFLINVMHWLSGII